MSEELASRGEASVVRVGAFDSVLKNFNAGLVITIQCFAIAPVLLQQIVHEDKVCSAANSVLAQRVERRVLIIIHTMDKFVVLTQKELYQI